MQPSGLATSHSFRPLDALLATKTRELGRVFSDRADPAPTNNGTSITRLVPLHVTPARLFSPDASTQAKRPSDKKHVIAIAMADHAQARVAFPRYLRLPNLWFRHHQRPPFPRTGQLLFADPVPGYVVVEPAHCLRHAG
jgi:hypothetical protein